MGEPTMISTEVLKRNPFPGIRPFSSAEDKYFFGREGVIAELLDLFQANRFVALVGASASGKTSLIQSGIIPALITQEKQEWIPVTISPGLKPLESLIRGFQQVFPKKLNETDIQSFLSGTQELSDLIIEKGLGSHNYCLVVDQFEDLFRSGPQSKTSLKPREIRRFVDLLVNAAKSDRPDIYVLLSIRSDFIEASSEYRSLTELMNRSKYLLPPMSREALSAAISGPVQQAGASLEPGFVDVLLDDLDDLEIPLPKLQHALMRTWETWLSHEKRDQSITVRDYQSVGTVKSVLCDHLEETFNELDEKQKLICERLFKSITSKSQQYNGFRRAATMGNIARISHCSYEDLCDVVEVFRQPGRAFLLPYATHSLSPDSIVELSHESLIRIWDRLHDWVDEEDESIRMYLKLSEASALYQQGRTELWVNPELQIAIKWRESQNPTPAWGVQFNPAFERAMVFLSTSEEELQWEEERKVMLQKRRLMLNRFIAIFMGVLVIVLGAVVFKFKRQPGPVTQVENNAEPSENASGPITPEPQISQQPLEQAETRTPEESANTEGIREEDNFAQQAPSSENELSPSGKTSNTSGGTPVKTVLKPGTKKTEKTDAASSTGSLVNRDMKREFISRARDVASQSLSIDKDPTLQGLLALEAYRVNLKNDGLYYDRDIYMGLYAVSKKLISPAYNIYPNLRSSIKDMTWLSRTGSILTVSSDGSMKILSGNLANRASQIALPGTGLANECLAISPDEKIAVVGTNGGGLLFLELENQGKIIFQDTDHGKAVLFLTGLGNTGSFISAGTENSLLKYDFNTYESTEFVKTTSRPSALAATRDGKKVAYGTRDGKLFEVNVSVPGEGRQIASFDRFPSSLAYSAGGQNLVVGFPDGTVRILSGNSREVIVTLRGAGAGITDLDYSPNGRFLAAASRDGNVYLWNTTDWDYPPLVFDENNGFVLSVCFSRSGEHFYSGSVDFPRFIGRPTEASGMADEFCSLLERNLTKAEWEQYFGIEIPYEPTCPDLN